jgi:acyl-coenzyme A synthetase/AMP-(fatty) acid ligase
MARPSSLYPGVQQTIEWAVLFGNVRIEIERRQGRHVVSDGGPTHADLGTLWRLAAAERVSYFGTPAPYVQTCLKEGLRPASVFGGTDLCAAFVGAAPDVPVWLGELSCRMLGAPVAAYDEAGREVVDEVGSTLNRGGVRMGTSEFYRVVTCCALSLDPPTSFGECR